MEGHAVRVMALAKMCGISSARGSSWWVKGTRRGRNRREGVPHLGLSKIKKIE